MAKRKENKILYGIIAIVAVFAVSGIATAYSMNVTNYFKGDQIINEAVQFTPKEATLGAFPGPDLYSDIRIHGNLTTGGSVLATSTTGIATTTLAFADLNNYNQIDLYSIGVNYEYVLPATSTMTQILPDIGDYRSWLIHNVSTTTTLRIVAGTGTDLVDIDKSTSVLAAESWAKLDCWQIYYRTANNLNFACSLDEYIAAD